MNRYFIAVLFLLLPVFNHQAGAMDDAAYRAMYTKQYVKCDYQVFLPLGMKKALKRYDPAFTILELEDFDEDLKRYPQSRWTSREAYSAVFGDFDGDERIDAAVLGASSGSPLKILAVLSQGTTTYQVFMVEETGLNKPSPVYLSLVRAGEKVSDTYSDDGTNMKSREVLLKNDAIAFTYPEKGGSLYHWDKSKNGFVQLGGSD